MCGVFCAFGLRDEPFTVVACRDLAGGMGLLRLGSSVGGVRGGTGRRLQVRGRDVECVDAVLQLVVEVPAVLVEVCGDPLLECPGPGVGLGEKLLALLGHVELEDGAVPGAGLARHEALAFQVGHDRVHALWADHDAPCQLGRGASGGGGEVIEGDVLRRGEIQVGQSVVERGTNRQARVLELMNESAFHNLHVISFLIESFLSGY